MKNEKKATVRDIAKKAGVSVATVSYVLNDKEGAKISASTRKKVLQVANLLNYSIPEKYKTGSAPKSSYSIGIIYSLSPQTPSRNAEIMSLINLLAERFGRMKFDCRLLPIEPEMDAYEPVQGLDGIIAIDLSEKDFKKMSGGYFIPILCLDMIINDFLFYQIHTDIEKIIGMAKEKFGDTFYLVTDKYYNEGYADYIASAMPKGKTVIFSTPSSQKEKMAALKDRKLLVLGQYLGMEIKSILPSSDIIAVSTEEGSYNKDILPFETIHNDLNKKANLAVSIMMNALEKKFDVKHEYKV